MSPMPSVLLALAMGLSAVTAFPAMSAEKRQSGNPTGTSFTINQSNCGTGGCNIFNAAEQLVDISGAHAFVAPGPGDIRGPCSGLNALANHGYIPRGGVVSISETIDGMARGLGVGADLAGFLAILMVVESGDPGTQTWSIGGPYAPSGLTAVTGYPAGISYAHNKAEGDSSPSRSDAYLGHGDAHSLNMTKFQRLYSVMAPSGSNSIAVMRDHIKWNQDQSIANNPWYFSGPVSGTAVVNAAHYFISTIMSNHTAENPEGYMNGDILKTFMGVSGTYPNFVWNKGQEHLPTNWYRRPTAFPYTFSGLSSDISVGFNNDPTTVRIGGNMGATNTFAGVNMANLTGGTFNSESLLQGNNLACFIAAAAQLEMFASLDKVYSAATPIFQLVNTYTAPLLLNLSCPQMANYEHSVFDPYPGFSYNPTGPATSY